MIARVSHDHPVFDDDNAKVFQFLEEATRGTLIASTIAPWKGIKYGRRAFFAIVAQHAGIDKWESVIKAAENFLKSSKLKGNINYTLEKHCDGHRQIFILCGSISQFSSEMKDPELNTYSIALNAKIRMLLLS